ncbi:asparagine synthase (glutamine-hydrolyzing) [Sphingomonas sp. DG1-23]|uniref:asparagine synthase (glutamine-hydrolyzing) n=1 Tax=Sphingomonas sp. DG1-23 TaxID=3068316 RepID=UPI00273F0981|nr:asparagine synthase (glutamine-hydrolyzing) [Sphingomonas sp. DG1-23]MDP5280681.1 asparagine synthase (glutamine-hydrolyzing) [Sphingomonas sp. DG1-23]
MCGITGIFAFAGKRQVEAAHLTAMRDTMLHRGPDGGGLWISDDRRVGLGHRRLSIIDLSASADQPMTNADKSVWLTYNGEIYNHVALRAELVAAGYKFVTDHSDTEVLVHGYSAWGIDGLAQRIEGDYAFAIWDAKLEKLFLLRDRIGVKPLYFAMPEGEMVFGSEIKAILKHPAIKASVDPIAMYHYLSFLTTPAPLTMFSGVFKLPAGHYAEIGVDGRLKATRYWDAKPGLSTLDQELKGLSDSAQESLLVDGVRSRLRDAVGKRMMSDVPFGVFLSGGIDSSTNVALMAELMDRPVDTFSVGFKDFKHLNELEYADQVSKEFKTNHHEILIDEADMKGYLGDLIHSQDEPIADWVCIPLYFVSKLAKDSGVTVVQVGEGSDEQFCGYASYMGYLDLYQRYWSPYRKFTPTFARKAAAAVAQRLGRAVPKAEMYADILDRAARDREHFWSGATVFWDTLKSRLVHKSAVKSNADYRPLIDSGLMPDSYLELDTFNVIKSFNDELTRTNPDHDVLQRMIYNEFKLRLPELLLMRVDKIGMSVSIEARVPFLDHKLVEYSLDIPMEQKIKGRTAKYILKKAVEGIIPNNIIYRKKMGFGAPMSQWLSGDFGNFVQNSMKNSALMQLGFLDVDYIKMLFDDHRSGKRDNSLYIWTLFNLSAWYDYWVDGSH